MQRANGSDKREWQGEPHHAILKTQPGGLPRRKEALSHETNQLDLARNSRDMRGRPG